MIGKYPPVQGGVSAHTYWCVHGLAALGHQVHVLTNANEVEQRFRLWMRPEDWRRCECEYPGGGSVRVHWTDADLDRQRHIPWSNPFLTKLTSAAVQAIREHDLELIFSYYLEPYGVAGHLAAQITGKPHVLRPAGSDFGRLRTLPQFRPLYDSVLRSAARVLIGGAGREELAGCRISDSNDYRLPDTLFRPEGKRLDVGALAQEVGASPGWPPIRIGAGFGSAPCLGIYGKISEPKGTFDLLHALAVLRRKGQPFHLLAMAHGWGSLEERFQETLGQLGLEDCVTQLPFLPHWRVPDFLRLCQAVCFLERDFPIAGHAPTVPREVFACGRCLVASAPILRDQLLARRLVHRYNCVAVEDVRDVEELHAALQFALEDPGRAARIGQQGHQYSRRCEQGHEFPRNYETLFAEVIEGREPSPESLDFPWCRLAGVRLGRAPEGDHELFALSVYKELLEMEAQGQHTGGLLLDAVRFELHASGMLLEEGGQGDALFRLACADPSRDLSALRPAPAPGLTIRHFDHDVGALAHAHERDAVPWGVPPQPSCAAFLPGGLVFSLNPEALGLLSYCDGARTIAQLAEELAQGSLREAIQKTLVEWFEAGLIALREEG